MRQRSGRPKEPPEKVVKDVRRATRKRHSPEEKIGIVLSGLRGEDSIAGPHAEAWRYAFRGIIPGIALERMIARRGPIWWQAVCASRDGALVLEFDRRFAGYATFGRCRAGPMSS